MKFGLVPRIVSLSIILLVSIAALISFIALNEINNDIKSNVADEQEKSLRTAAIVFSDKVPGFGVTYDSDGNVAKITAESIPDFFEHSFIDTVGKITGEKATIFKYEKENDDYMRVTTNIITAEGKRAVGTPLGKASAAYPVIKSGKTFTGEAAILGKDYYTVYAPIFTADGNIIGIVFAGVEKAKMVAVIETINKNILSFTIPAVLVALLLMIFVLGYLLKPIPVITEQIQSLADGKTNVDITVSNRRDEIGSLQKAMLALKGTVLAAFKQAQMIENMPTPVFTAEKTGSCAFTYANRAALELVGKINKTTGLSASNLVGSSVDKLDSAFRDVITDPSKQPFNKRVHIDGEVLDIGINPILDTDGSYISPMLSVTIQTQQEKIAQEFEKNVEGAIRNLNNALESVRNELGGVSALALDNAGRSTTVAAAAEEAGTNVHTVAAAVEELSASIREISEQVSRSTKLTSGAVNMAQQAGEKASSLKDASKRIGDVLEMISEIAEQTNLLALNATIEAARAGDAGKGFAVVAGEVKNLANETAKATSGVETEIQSVNRAVVEVVEAISGMAKTINDINGIFTTVASSVEEQNIATGEITRNVQQAAVGTQEVVKNIQSVKNASTQTGTAVQTVMEQADLLAGESGKLSTAAKDFLISVRKG